MVYSFISVSLSSVTSVSRHTLFSSSSRVVYPLPPPFLLSFPIGSPTPSRGGWCSRPRTQKALPKGLHREYTNSQLKFNPTPDGKMTLKVYCDRMSQPSRAILIFCKMNGIDFKEIAIDISKNQQRTPEYKAINPMCQVPTIVDGDFTLFESHSILIYLSCKYPGVASHWYPSDVIERAKVHSVLDWHHANLRRGSVGVIVNNVMSPLNGVPPNPQATEEAEKTLQKALTVLETFWLKDGPFLVGRSQPSIADLNLVSEVMELDQLLSEELRDRVLSPYKKVLQWVEDTRSATAPHFEEIHGVLYKAGKEYRERLASISGKNE